MPTFTLSNLTVGTVLDIVFPSLNKNDNLADNDREIQRKSYVNKSVILKVIHLSCEAEWQSVTNNLLDDMAMWEKVGGSTLIGEDAEVFSHLCAEHGVDPDDYSSVINNEVTFNWFRDRSVVQVVAVFCEGKEPFFVNTEGFTYARYVGRMVQLP